jgi:hypothetical protein
MADKMLETYIKIEYDRWDRQYYITRKGSELKPAHPLNNERFELLAELEGYTTPI